MTETLWNERYKNEAYIYGTEPNLFLTSAARFLKPQSDILCLAEGEGRNGVFLARQGHRVSAFDLSSEGKKKAQRLAAANKVALDYTVCDVRDYDFEQRAWDAVISIFAHTDPDTRHAAWKNITRTIKDNGLFILEAYHPRQIADRYGTGGPKQIDWLVSLEELHRFFDGFDILHEAEIERDVQEGLFHNGKACVTQFICRRPAA